MAVMAAVLLVASAALATLGPPGIPLGQLLFLIDHTLFGGIQHFVDTYLGHGIWLYVLVPLWVRPAWLGPASLGIICAGVAMTLASRQGARNQHHRRS
jgi:hypothetical protein